MDAQTTGPQMAAEDDGLMTLGDAPGAYEMRPCPGAPWTRLDEAALNAFFAARPPDVAAQPGPAPGALALREKFTLRRDSKIHPTVAGYVLFGVHPEAWQPAWRVTALRLGGTVTTAPIVDRLDTEGPAPRAIGQVEGFLRRHLGVVRLPADRRTGAEGEDVPEYPLAAALEAIANAVAHRDYTAPSQVFVRLYEDRLEIRNPGGLLPGRTLQQMLAGGASRPRNPLIAETLRQMGLMAEAGRGLALIRQQMQDLGFPPPVFAADAQHFRVTLRLRRSRASSLAT